MWQAQAVRSAAKFAQRLKIVYVREPALTRLSFFLTLHRRSAEDWTLTGWTARRTGKEYLIVFETEEKLVATATAILLLDQATATLDKPTMFPMTQTLPVEVT